LAGPLGELDQIKHLPGFQRAAAGSLSQAWSAGLDLADEVAAAGSPAARGRLQSMSLRSGASNPRPLPSESSRREFEIYLKHNILKNIRPCHAIQF
jgi:hypothetical protein